MTSLATRAWKVASGEHQGAVLLELGPSQEPVLTLQRDALRATPWEALLDYVLVSAGGQLVRFETRAYSVEDELGLETSRVDGQCLRTLQLVLRTGPTLKRHETSSERVRGLELVALAEPGVQAALAQWTQRR